MATSNELLAARIVCRAVLPVVKVMISDSPEMRRRFERVTGVVRFVARDPEEPVGAKLRFDAGQVDVVPGPGDGADITFSFSSVAKMNAMFAGKPVIPGIRGWTHPVLLLKTFRVLLGLKLLMPTAKPKTPEMARLKVKMTLFMVSTALSQLNKSGDPEMAEWTAKQPERIYQWSVDGEDDIACYLKVKAGQTKAGRGLYTRRKPFVHMKFRSVQDALPVLSNSIDTVEAMAQGLVANEGSPEYGARLGDFMLRIAALLS